MLLSFCVKQFKCLRDGWSWDSVNTVWGMENNTSKAAPVRRIRIILRQCHDVPWLPSSLLHRKCVLVFDSFSINKWNIIRKTLTNFGFHFVTHVEKYQNILMHILARLLQDTVKAWQNQLHARPDLDKPFLALFQITQLEIPPWSGMLVVQIHVAMGRSLPSYRPLVARTLLQPWKHAKCGLAMPVVHGVLSVPCKPVSFSTLIIVDTNPRTFPPWIICFFS